jgi:hypothetical protein
VYSILLLKTLVSISADLKAHYGPYSTNGGSELVWQLLVYGYVIKLQLGGRTVLKERLYRVGIWRASLRFTKRPEARMKYSRSSAIIRL